MNPLLPLLLAAFSQDPAPRPQTVHDHARVGDVARLRAMLARDAKLLTKLDRNRRTPLHVAARAGQLPVARLLLEAGAPVDPPAYNGFTPLHLAALSNHKTMVQLLLEKGADVRKKTGYGKSILEETAFRGHRDVVRVLLYAGADYDIVSATRLGDITRVEALVARDKSLARGYDVLRAAAQGGHAAIVALLLAHGADPNQATWHQPPVLVVSLAHAPVVKLLLDAGADAGARVRMKGVGPDSTLLHMAAGGGHARSVELLLAAGAAAGARSKSGRTPLHDAAHGGHVAAAKRLLAAGADLDARDNAGATAMAVAAAAVHATDYHKANRGLFATMRLFAAKGAPVDLFAAIALGDAERTAALLAEEKQLAGARDFGKRPALVIATSHGHTAIAKLLLASGADPNAAREDGYAALHIAAFWGRTEIARALIGSEADLNARARGGYTPLHESARLGTPQVAALLLAAGAEVNARDDQGRTPLSWIRKKTPSHAAVRKIIEKNGGTE